MVGLLRLCALILIAFIVISKAWTTGTSDIRYEPNWKSLDSRPLPRWYDDAKFGIFMHWGVYTVPGYTGAWMWHYWKGPRPVPRVVKYMQDNYPPGFTYADFAAQFRPTFYDPKRWAEIFKASGARYVVLTSKHHEGFTNFPSPNSWNWNSVDVGPHKDLVGMFVDGIRNNSDIHIGLYYSLFEFFNPLYLEDKKNGFKTNRYVKTKPIPDLQYIVNKYKPEVLWSDGDWEAPDSYWMSTDFLAWLYNQSPVRDTVVTNDRWGHGTACRHGGYLTCKDRYNPGKLQERKWENAMTLDRNYWGYVRNVSSGDLLTMDELTATLAQTVSCGGNMLLNVGPTADGTIAPMFEERLRQMGAWLAVNGEAIYASAPWSSQNDTATHGVWYTSKKSEEGTAVYAIVLEWPQGNRLFLGSPSPSTATRVSLLGYHGNFKWEKHPGKGMTIHIPDIPMNRMPCDWAWVFKLTGLTT